MDEGGENSAPCPFDLFLASISTCTGIYVYRFCQQRTIPPEKITLDLTMQRNEKTSMVEMIAITVNVPDDFPLKYKNALLRAANLCTIKKLLEHPPTIDISISKK